jgi:hypothetical protein
VPNSTHPLPIAFAEIAANDDDVRGLMGYAAVRGFEELIGR